MVGEAGMTGRGLDGMQPFFLPGLAGASFWLEAFTKATERVWRSLRRLKHFWDHTGKTDSDTHGQGSSPQGMGWKGGGIKNNNLGGQVLIPSPARVWVKVREGEGKGGHPAIRIPLVLVWDG